MTKTALWVLCSTLMALCVSCAGAPEQPTREGLEAERLLSALSSPGAELRKARAGSPSRPHSLLTQLAIYQGDQGSQRVRAVLTLDRELPFRRRERALASGARSLVIDLEDAQGTARVPRLAEVGAGGLVRVITVEQAEGLSVVLELSNSARYRMFALHEPFRLVLDIEEPQAATKDGAPLVLIDPGHGGEDRGSPGPFGLWEGKLTLDISRRVQRMLAQIAPQVRTRLTRDSDVYITLEERAAMANSLGADLFVSVHLNAANTTVEKGGVATYVLDINNDRNVQRLAARENGISTSSVSPMQFLVGSLARSEQRSRSVALAHYVQRGTLFSARRYLPSLADRGVKSAMFYVLVGAEMPAILVEGSFITQPDEAHALTTTPYREAIAEGIARGIAKYLADR